MNQQPISIPKPCHENWNKMTPAEQGRHCDVCSKVVKDFTGMSTPQILQTLKEEAHHGDSVCGRINVSQLTPANPKQKIYFWVNGVLIRKGLYGLMGLLGFGFFTKKVQAQIQGGIPVKGKMVAPVQTHQKKLKIFVRNEFNQPVNGATVSFSHGTLQEVIKTTNASGLSEWDFTPEELTDRFLEGTVSAPGYESKTLRVELNKDLQTIVIKLSERYFIMGDISLPLEEKAPPVIIDTTTVLPVEPEVVICTAQPPLQVEEIPTELLDTLPQAILNNMDNNEWIPVGISEGADDNIQPQFAAYPVPGDQYINFTTTLNEPFDMHVFDAAGKKLSGIIYARGQYTLDVSSYPSGTYYVLMVVNNHAVETRKIIVRHP